MRVANNAEELPGAFQMAKSEAKACFGDDEVYMEKLVTGPEAAEFVDLRLPVKQNLHLVAKAKGKKVSELQSRIEKLEDELEAAHAIVRAAMKYIRKLWRWSDQRDIAHQRGVEPPPQPELPELLKDEV